MPDLAGLLRQRLHQSGVRMTQRIHRDAGTEIQIALAVLRIEARAFAMGKGDIGAGERRQQRREVGHDFIL
jgi:hypothetical protein